MADYYRNCRSMENQTLAFVPKDVIGYQWGACLDLGAYYNEIMKELEGSESGQAYSQLSNVESVLGMSLRDDVLPAFGDEWGGYLQDIQQFGSFPIAVVSIVC